jgi:Domain of unknown function (DUF6134)
MSQGGRCGKSGTGYSRHKFAGLLLVLCLCQITRADEKEVRDFAISIDGRQAGRYQITINSQKDGDIVVEAEAKVVLNYLVYRYTYSFHGKERWRGGRLMWLGSISNDNGKRFRVEAISEGNEARVTVNGKANKYRADVWTTTYWQLPDKRYRNQGIPLLDSDTGRYLEGNLQFVDRENVLVAGELQPCAHYSITAPGIDVEAWYDDRERLVRQTAREDGHRTVLSLSALKRN